MKAIENCIFTIDCNQPEGSQVSGVGGHYRHFYNGFPDVEMFALIRAREALNARINQLGRSHCEACDERLLLLASGKAPEQDEYWVCAKEQGR